MSNLRRGGRGNAPADASPVRATRGVRHWELWSQHTSFVLALGALCVTAAAVGVTTLLHDAGQTSTWVRAGAILLLSAAFELVTAKIDGQRRQLAAGPFVDMSSVWTFAAAVVLPPGQASLLIVALGLQRWLGRQRKNGARPYRHLVTWVAILIAVQCASGALTYVRPRLESLPAGVAASLTVVTALVVYFTVDGLLLFGLRYLAVRPVPVRSMRPSTGDAGLELATLCLGGLAALTLMHQPWLILLVLPPMFILQRGALVTQLEHAATTDAKTGLLNATTWEQLAQREIARAEREHSRLALFILDLDFFKHVNDQHGHLVGDAALVDVARCLTHELRTYDVIGRFGGEEFVALLPDIDLPEAGRVAERIRQRIAAVSIMPMGSPKTDRSESADPDSTLSASIGVAGYPVHGTDLPTLLHRADSALYVAKRTGRNRVSIADQDGSGPLRDDVPVPAR